MLSFWEKTHFVNYDYLIIGAGIMGLSTAASLLEKHPDKKIMVMERGVLPTGASTKNAGFACFGSLTELLADLNTMTAQEMVALVDERWSGLRKLRARLGDEALRYRSYGGYELISEKEINALERMDEINELLFPLFGEPVFSVDHKKLDDFGFNKDHVECLVYNQFEGQIDSGRMMKQLLRYLHSKGITILTGCEVDSIEDEEEFVIVNAKSTTSNETIPFIVQKVAVCTNAFTKKLVPSVSLTPARGQVLVTHPVKDLKFKGSFHFDEGYYYFRNYKNRVIFGGGRNIDFEGETSTECITTKNIIENLKEKLGSIILPDQMFEIEYEWSGIMAFGENKRPVCERVSKNVLVGGRLGGMGVALGSNMGEQLALMMVS